MMPVITVGKEGNVVSRKRVLVVDGLVETEEVLRAVLEPRGLEVTRVNRLHGPHVSGSARPSVLVIHEDERTAGSRPVRDEWPPVPRVVIGRYRNARRRGDRDCRYLPQPFDYAELVGAIESLLDTQR
jgi:hypothetical protein